MMLISQPQIFLFNSLGKGPMHKSCFDIFKKIPKSLTLSQLVSGPLNQLQPMSRNQFLNVRSTDFPHQLKILIKREISRSYPKPTESEYGDQDPDICFKHVLNDSEILGITILSQQFPNFFCRGSFFGLLFVIKGKPCEVVICHDTLCWLAYSAVNSSLFLPFFVFHCRYKKS